jgi:hypothetical protein
VIPVAVLMLHKTVWRIAGRSLLLLAAMAALTGWRLTAAFAQASGESSAVSVDDTDLTGIDATTEGESSCDAGDQTPKPEASDQTSSGGATGQPSTGGTPNASSTQKQPKTLSVNPVTGMVSASEANYEPLSGKERVKIYFKMNYGSVGAYFGPFFTALVLDQATGSPAQWGGGFAGYGRRVASRLGTAILQGTFQAPVAALLHEDVRYIASSQHGAKRRAWHAVKYSFLTYNTHGQATLNVANLSSYYAATAISTAWLPSHNNLATYTLSNATEQVGLSIPINLLQEFWPEIRHAVLKR